MKKIGIIIGLAAFVLASITALSRTEKLKSENTALAENQRSALEAMDVAPIIQEVVHEKPEVTPKTVPQAPIDPILKKAIDDIVVSVNQYRKTNGLIPLVRMASLERAAFTKANSIVVAGELTHANPSKSVYDVDYLTKQAGYRLNDYRIVGENLACTPEPYLSHIVDKWIASKLHNINLLDPEFSEYGIGFARGNVNYNSCKSSEDIVLVMVFGGVR